MGPSLKTSPKRIGHTYKYYVTAFGESVLLAGLKVKELALIPDLAVRMRARCRDFLSEWRRSTEEVTYARSPHLPQRRASIIFHPFPDGSRKPASTVP
jgi:hypothetical protein